MLLSVCLLFWSGCSGDGGSSGSGQICDPGSNPVSSLTVTAVAPVLSKGKTLQFTAIGTYPDSTTQDLTNLVTWSSSDTAKVSIDAYGLATGEGVGPAAVSATSTCETGALSVRTVAGFGNVVSAPSPSGVSVGDTVLGDLNGDGRNDVAVVAPERFGSGFLVYFQNSGATLDPAQVMTTDLEVTAIAAGDVNNDGLDDLVVSGTSTTATAGYLGRAAVYYQDAVLHTLDGPHYIGLSMTNVGSLALADLNADGRTDIVSAGTGTGTSSIVSFRFQGGGGALLSEVTYTGAAYYNDASYHGELHTADMNNDGLNDIVLQSGAKEVSVIRQTAPGMFSSTPDQYPVQTSYWPFISSFSLGDLNGDGLTDMIVDDPGNSGYLNIFLQNGSGSLTGPTFLTVSAYAYSEVDIADLDGDGLNEVILLAGGDTVHMFYQNAGHDFQGPVALSLPTSTHGGTPIHQALTVGDMNNDLLPDIVASWSHDGVFVVPRMP